MWKYIGRRLIQLIPVILAISFITFALMQTASGDVVDTMYENAGGAAVRRNIGS